MSLHLDRDMISRPAYEAWYLNIYLVLLDLVFSGKCNLNYFATYASKTFRTCMLLKQLKLLSTITALHQTQVNLKD